METEDKPEGASEGVASGIDKLEVTLEGPLPLAGDNPVENSTGEVPGLPEAEAGPETHTFTLKLTCTDERVEA